MFIDRADAGRQLADALEAKAYPRPLVLGIPRGGIPVALETALRLRAPLDTIVVRKIGAPFNPEFAVGAIAPPDIVFVDDDSVSISGSSRAAVDGVVGAEREELRRRVAAYKSGSYAAGYVPQTVIVIDDGVATGNTTAAALRSVRARYRKAKLVLAVPVGVPESLRALKKEADEVVCLAAPKTLYAVAQAYSRFDQVSDAQVLSCLDHARRQLQSGKTQKATTSADILEP